ncbi:MAG: cobalamin biosynthesis protein [Treponema sp.]|jgi:cobalt-precorrin 5A hydrolase|nr:cobalamin biosynthesis protein [Treponema sp.]
MKIAIIAVSGAGASLALSLAPALSARGVSAAAYVYSPYKHEGQENFESLAELTLKLWSEAEGLIFLCASGIAVRMIAPLVRSKHEDPAVVVCAENGSYVFSLLSGHEGGANALARLVADCAGAIPVITTASEVSPPASPRNLVAGIGCKRGTSAETLQGAVVNAFTENRLSPLRLRLIASISIKHDEPGLSAAAESFGVPLVFYSSQELNAVSGCFRVSGFVKRITGVDNICERAAVLASGGGRLLAGKTAYGGVTVAVAEKP